MRSTWPIRSTIPAPLMLTNHAAHVRTAWYLFKGCTTGRTPINFTLDWVANRIPSQLWAILLRAFDTLMPQTSTARAHLSFAELAANFLRKNQIVVQANHALALSFGTVVDTAFRCGHQSVKAQIIVLGQDIRLIAENKREDFPLQRWVLRYSRVGTVRTFYLLKLVCIQHMLVEIL